jgi:hypothetical protein
VGGGSAEVVRWLDLVPPYNEHLTPDPGAFQIGIGAALLLSLLLDDVLTVALGGFLAGGTLHVFNHAIDGHLGGHPSDPWWLAAQVLLAAVALGIHLRNRSRLRRQQDSDPPDSST